MKKAISIFLSLLMLASSSGIAYAQHFCSGTEMASQITLGEKFLSCGMEECGDPSCDDNSNIAEDHCCQNHFTQIDTDENFAKASFEIKFQKFFIANIPAVFVPEAVEIVSIEKTFFAEYNPPPLEQDLNILYDTFLI